MRGASAQRGTLPFVPTGTVPCWKRATQACIALVLLGSQGGCRDRVSELEYRAEILCTDIRFRLSFTQSLYSEIAAGEKEARYRNTKLGFSTITGHTSAMRLLVPQFYFCASIHQLSLVAQIELGHRFGNLATQFSTSTDPGAQAQYLGEMVELTNQVLEQPWRE